MNFEKYGIATPQELMDYFQKNMNYGFVYKNKVYTDFESDFQTNMDKFYKLRLGEDFLKSGYGVCWDFCECERKFFEFANIEHKCYFIESYLNSGEGGPTHTFALFKKGDKWCWFEYAWQFYRGIHQYATVEQAIDDVLEKFKSFFNGNVKQVRLYVLPKFSKRVNTFEFVEQCVNSDRLK